MLAEPLLAPSASAYDLLDEVRGLCTRDDDFPDDLLQRIDAYCDHSGRRNEGAEQPDIWQAWLPSEAKWGDINPAQCKAWLAGGGTVRGLRIVQQLPGRHAAPAAPVAHLAAALRDLHAELGAMAVMAPGGVADGQAAQWHSRAATTLDAIATAMHAISACSTSLYAAPLADADRYFAPTFEVWSGGTKCASSTGLRDEALVQALEAGEAAATSAPARVFEVVRALVWDSAVEAGLPRLGGPGTGRDPDTAPAPPLRAYVLKEGDDPDLHSTIVVYASGREGALVQGARQLGLQEDEVESCVRAPELDQYAPGPVSALDLIDHQWTFTCSHCEAAVDAESADDDGEPHAPRPDGQDGVYCSAACEAMAYADQRSLAAAKTTMVALIEAKFPGAFVTDVHVYGPGALHMEPRHSLARFTFPGGQHEAEFDLATPEMVHLVQSDVQAWNAWRRPNAADPLQNTNHRHLDPLPGVLEP